VQARERVKSDALATDLPTTANLRDSGTGATAYADALGCI
jgi:hypothetical protein